MTKIAIIGGGNGSPSAHEIRQILDVEIQNGNIIVVDGNLSDLSPPIELIEGVDIRHYQPYDKPYGKRFRKKFRK